MTPVTKEVENIPAHDWKPRQTDNIFFAPPPTEIGEIITAESACPAKPPKALIVRLIPGIVLAVGVLVAALFWAQSMKNDQDGQDLAFLIGGILFLIILIATLIKSRFKTTCSYVGTQGIAFLSLGGSLENQPTGQLLLFSNAASLLTGIVRRYVNGVYSGTTASYTWSDAMGKKVYGVKLSFNDRKTLKEGHRIRFLRAAETVWSQWALARAQAELQQNGCITFPIDRKLTVQVGQGFLRFLHGGTEDTVQATDIASVSLQQGRFTIKHKDATWYSRAGKYGFQYAQMPNARVFMMALEKLVGFSF